MTPPRWKEERVKRPLAFAGAVALAGLASACGGGGGGSGAATINWYIYNDGTGQQGQIIASCNKQAQGAYKIKLVSLPSSADDQRALLVRRLAAKDSSIDIMGMDVVWTAEFANAGWLLPWTGADKTAVSKGTLAGPLASATYDGKLYAAPLNSNTQLLWYRKDLVKTAPKTWDQLIAASKALKAAGKSPSLIEEQGKRYEGLTVWFNALVASAGGTIVNAQNQPTLGAPAEQAASIIRQVAQPGVGDPSISNSAEDDGRHAFENGAAAFMLNWPYVYATGKADGAQDPKVLANWKNMAWAPYPAVTAGKVARPPLGGATLGISSHSAHPKQAFAAATCIRSEPSQVIAGVVGGLPPTIDAAYDDKKLRVDYPFADVLREGIKNAAPRPVTPAYADVSLAITKALAPVGSVAPQAAVKSMGSNLTKAADGGLF
jgi:multiple sugar transport system substrate-binding protein